MHHVIVFLFESDMFLHSYMTALNALGNENFTMWINFSLPDLYLIPMTGREISNLLSPFIIIATILAGLLWDPLVFWIYHLGFKWVMAEWSWVAFLHCFILTTITHPIIPSSDLHLNIFFHNWPLFFLYFLFASKDQEFVNSTYPCN